MPRQARVKSEFSIYHVIQRGNEKKNIFTNDDDRKRFLETLYRMKVKYNFFIYSYCLMDNHVHLLIDDNGNDISKLIKSINISYVYYFNRTYRRCGHLFQDRFRSELIDSDAYLMEVSRYIHNNPVKAGIVKNPEDYKWSSYNAIIGNEKVNSNLTDKGRLLKYFSDNNAIAVKEYISYVSSIEAANLEMLDIEDNTSYKDNGNNYISTMDQARTRILEEAKEEGLSYIQVMSNKKIRDEMIKRIRKNSSLTLKQIGELFGGISESRVSRILTNR